MNKFIRKIDKLFEKYGKSKNKIILCCMDEFCPCWDYYCYSGGPITHNTKAIDPVDDKEAESFDAELTELIDMLMDSFQKELALEAYESKVNEWYIAYVYVDKTYKIRCTITDGSYFNDESGDVLVNLNLYDEGTAEKKFDDQICDIIKDAVERINEQIGKLKSDEGRARVREILAIVNTNALNGDDHG